MTNCNTVCIKHGFQDYALEVNIKKCYRDTDVETQHNRDVVLGNVFFSVSVRG